MLYLSEEMFLGFTKVVEIGSNQLHSTQSLADKILRVTMARVEKVCYVSDS